MDTLFKALTIGCSLVSVLWIVILLKDRIDTTFRPVILTAVITGAISILIATFMFRFLYFSLVYHISFFQDPGNLYLPASLNILFFELVKYAVFRIYIYPKKEFSNITSGIVFMTAIAVGAVLMRGTLLFVRQSFSFQYINFPIMLAISILSAIIMGYFIGVEKIKEEGGTEFHMFAIGGAVLFNVIFLFLFNWKSAFSDVVASGLILGGTYLFHRYNLINIEK